MIEIDVPGRRVYRLEHLVLDLNGTITLDGSIIEGVIERLDLLHKSVNIVVVTADTRGRAQDLGQSIAVEIHRLDPADEKAQKSRLVQVLGSEMTIAIGNGSNDSWMLRDSIVGVCVLSAEGSSAEAIANCDVLVPSINAALDLLIKPERLIATLRQ